MQMRNDEIECVSSFSLYLIRFCLNKIIQLILQFGVLSMNRQNLCSLV